MNTIEHGRDGFVVDAGLLASTFRLAPESVPQLLREGAITSRCEAGIAEDAGRFRLVFLYAGRVLALTVDEAGQILERQAGEIGRDAAGGCIKTVIRALQRR